MPRLRLRPRLYPRRPARTGGGLPVVAVSTLVLIVAGPLSGCGETPQVVQYEIEKETVARPAAGAAVRPPFARPAADAAGQRMLAAIIPADAKTWFLKITGPERQVSAEEERFQAFLRSVSVESEEPPKLTWTLPAEWSEQPGSAFRYATIQLTEGDAALQMSVTVLETGSDLDEYVLANVNRWRDQLGWGPIEKIEPSDEISVVDLPSGRQATVVNLVGRSSAANSTPSTPQPGPRPPAADAGSPLTYDVPEGWAQGRVGGFRKAAFMVTEDDRQVEITAIDLPPSGLLANVNRWRGQVQLPPTTAEQLAEEVEEIEVDGLTGHFVELIGPEGAQPRQTILGVMVPRQDKVWFFKLTGDAQLAASQKEAFQSFVRSVRFTPAGQGAGDGQ